MEAPGKEGVSSSRADQDRFWEDSSTVSETTPEVAAAAAAAAAAAVEDDSFGVELKWGDKMRDSPGLLMRGVSVSVASV